MVKGVYEISFLLVDDMIGGIFSGILQGLGSVP